MSRIFVVGDIHGHNNGFEILLEKADFRPQQDQLFILGDFLDKRAEPSAAAYTIEKVKKWVMLRAKVIMGNHEWDWLQKYAVFSDVDPICGRVVKFLSELPFYIKMENYLFVHAGIRPEVDIHEQEIEDLIRIRDPFLSPSYIPPFPVVSGHTSTERLGCLPGTVYRGPNKIGIDTGAKHGQRLSLVDLTNSLVYSCSTAHDDLYSDIQVQTLEIC